MKKEIPNALKEVFRYVILDLLHAGVETIDAEVFYKRCKKITNKNDMDFPWLQFCDLLSISKCFVLDNGTHGTVTLPRPLLDWNKQFME
jgi:hypothetical protein